MAAARYRGVEIELLPQDPPAQRRPLYFPGGLTLKMEKELYYLAGDRLYINYPRMKRVSVDTHSFEHIIADNFRELIPPGALKDRIVIVGNNSTFFHDMHRTPLGVRSGSEIHSICISNILDHDMLYPLNHGAIILLILLTGVISLAAFPHMKPLHSFSVFICLIAMITASSILLFKYGRIFLELTSLLLVPALCYPIMSLFKTRETELELDTSLAIFDNLNILDRTRNKGSRWLSTILSLCCNSIKASGGWIQTIDEKGTFSVDAVFNMSSRAAPSELEGGLCRKVIERNTFILSRNLALEKELSPFERATEFYHLLCVPLPGATGAKGVMVLGKKFMDEFKENQVRQMMAIALITGAFIDNVSLNLKLEEVFLDTIASLAQAIDARDPYTYGHSRRVSEISGRIAALLKQTPEEAHRIEVAGILHDIGKIGVPESILQKPGKLTDEEFASMKKHPEMAVKILEPLDQFYSLLPLVAGHHEKMNGRGYPKGLQAGEIPFGARILAVADIYDALTSDRPYRKASTPGEALALMENQFKGDLDENVLQALREHLDTTGEL